MADSKDMDSTPFDAFDSFDDALQTKKSANELLGHVLVTIHGYENSGGGQIWANGVTEDEKQVSVRLMTVREGVDYLMKQPKWLNKGAEHVRNLVQQRFASGTQSQRPALSSFASGSSPMSVGVGGKILFESAIDVGTNGDRQLLAAYWATAMTRNAKDFVITAPAHLSVHVDMGNGHSPLKVSAHADVLDTDRAMVLRSGMTNNEINEAFSDLLSNRGTNGTRTNPGIILRLINQNKNLEGSGKPFRSYDIRCSKAPHEYYDNFSGELKTRHVSADAITTLREVWLGHRDHGYMQSGLERDKALLRDDMLRVVLSAISDHETMKARLLSPLIAGRGVDDAKRIFDLIRSGELGIEVIPYQRIDASKVLREEIRKEFATLASNHQTAINAARRSGIEAPKFETPYDKFTRIGDLNVKGEPLYAKAHIAVMIMGADANSGGAPYMTKWAFADISRELNGLNEIETRKVAGAAKVVGKANEQKNVTMHGGPSERASVVTANDHLVPIPKPANKVNRSDVLASVAAMLKEKKKPSPGLNNEENQPTID